MASKIILFTGPIHTGKTSKLEIFLTDKVNVAGLLCPDIDGWRHIRFLSNNVQKPLQVIEDYEEKITIGKYHFDAKIMMEASDYLSKLAVAANDYIIIDEIGKLELIDKGFEPGLSKLITNFKEAKKKPLLILVVRDYLLDEVIQKYGLNDPNIVFELSDDL